MYVKNSRPRISHQLQTFKQLQRASARKLQCTFSPGRVKVVIWTVVGRPIFGIDFNCALSTQSMGIESSLIMSFSFATFIETQFGTSSLKPMYGRYTKYKQLELRIYLCSMCWLFARAKQSVLGGLVLVVAFHRQSEWTWVVLSQSRYYICKAIGPG